MSLSLMERFYAKRLNCNDTKTVSEFLAKYCIGENNYMKLIKDTKDEDIIDYNNKRIKFRLKQPYSVGIFEKSTEKLVAVALGYVREKKLELDHEIPKNEISQITPIQLALNFVSTLEGDIFKMLNIDKVHEVGMGCIHPDYKNHGLMIMVVELAHHIARESGCKYSITKVTNEYLVKHVEKYNPERIKKQIKFLEYVDPITGINPFVNPKFPYVRAILLCLEINRLEPLNLTKLQSLL